MENERNIEHFENLRLNLNSARLAVKQEEIKTKKNIPVKENKVKQSPSQKQLTSRGKKSSSAKKSL